MVVTLKMIFELQAPYVVAYGERYPSERAGSFPACHDLAYPEIRCFNSLKEMVEDELRGWPHYGDDITRVLTRESVSPTYPASAPEEPSP
jgi:hypothetical protein